MSTKTKHFIEYEADENDEMEISIRRVIRAPQSKCSEAVEYRIIDPIASGEQLEVLNEALKIMDRARNILTDGNPTELCNWGMLDTRILRERLSVINTKQPVVQPIGEAVSKALENCRLYAARHRSQPWAFEILRFCENAGIVGNPMRTEHPITDGSGRETKKPDAPFGYTGVENSELARLREIEHRAWHVFDDSMDDDSGYLKIDLEISKSDLGILYELLPDDHPEVITTPPQSEAHMEVICESCGGKNWAGTCNQCIPY